MKCLCVGDIHIKVNNVVEIEEMSKKLVNLSEKIKPDFIVLLGDILDRHSTINVHCLMRAENLVLALSKISPVYVLVGNHDRPNNSNYLTEEHPFNSMKLWDNTFVIDKVKECTFQDKRFVFTPYVPPGRLMEALNTVENPLLNTTAIFAHQEIYNCKMGAIISEEGDKWDLSNPLLISGHIHDYDLLQPNMIYVGTPIQHNFSEQELKTVSLFTFLENEWKQERIDLGMIKKVTVYITPDQVHSYTPKPDKQIKLVIKGDEASIKIVAKLEKIQELKKMGIKVVFKTTESNIREYKITPKLSYRNRLLMELKDPDSINWFNKLFL